MDKLLWVAAPLLLALAAVLWRVWRRRAPSRLGLNVAFSVLLLVYVSATAGLGIFWVANQQLPVFDWHYLFGYATVLLLAVHLAFNLRVVLQFLRRRAGTRGAPGAGVPGAASPVARPSGTGRRPLLGFAGAGGLALAAGAGYLIGLRHGRTELQLFDAADPASASPPSAVSAAGVPAGSQRAATLSPRSNRPEWAVVEQFHAHSAHSRTGVLRRAASTDWGIAPAPFKRYPAAARQALPRPRPLAAAADATQTQAPPDPGVAELGTWLWLSAGIREERGGIVFRTSPSSGALFATELYVVALDLRRLDAGPWHYDPETHALQRLPAPLGAALPAALGPLELPAGCRALIIASAIFARSGHKYGDRTYRYVTADLGHTLENLRIAVLASGGASCHLLARFDDLAIGHALGLDERREGVLAVAAIATGTAEGPAAARPLRPAPPPSPATTLTEIPPIPPIPPPPRAAHWTSPVVDAFAAQGGRLGVTQAMQLATSLRPPPTGSVAPSAAASAAMPAARTTPPQATTAAPAPDGLPSPRELRPDWPQVIAQRRSVRRFASKPVSRQALADILWAMTSPAPLLSAAVRVDLLGAAAEGLEAAAWRHDRQSRTLQRRVLHGASLRQRARAAALDQDVIGDAAVVFVLSLDRDTLMADPLGPARAYRHGFIEAGLVGERLYLAAGALGLAVCAVGAFYDDEAAALVGIDPEREWVVHFAALGAPA